MGRGDQSDDDRPNPWSDEPGRNRFMSPAELDAFRRRDPKSLPLDRNRYGNRVLLATGPIASDKARKRSTVIDTDTWPHPVVWLVRLRFQGALPTLTINEGAWSAVPVSGGVSAIVRRGLDELAGMTDENYIVGLNFPAYHIAKKLTIDLQMADDEGVVADFAEAVAVPVCWADAITIAGGGVAGELGGYGTTVVSRVAATVVGTTLLAANQYRRQFYIQNNSVSTLAVKLGSGVNVGAGTESWSFLLPGGATATYESPIGGYTGIITGVWFAADAAGEALITEGRLP